MSNVIKYNLVIEDKPSFSDNELKRKQVQIGFDSGNKQKNLIAEARKQAENIIQGAKDKADTYIEESYNKSREIVEQAREKGYKEGYRKGYTEGKKDADELIEEANNVKKENLKNRKSLIAELEEDVIELVISNCEEILNTKLEEERECLITMIMKGLYSLHVSDSVTIKVSKEDFDVVDLSKSRILSMSSLIEDLTIKADISLKKGDCIIETTKGSVDVSLSSQLEEMKAVLYRLLNSEEKNESA